ncbi:Hypothetical protein D9617_6g092830 [Elsinoe fawcettii]|nr:Hypothetical protein D9617_6g092830 [Elsinoe fawcettii]
MEEAEGCDPTSPNVARHRPTRERDPESPGWSDSTKVDEDEVMDSPSPSPATSSSRPVTRISAPVPTRHVATTTAHIPSTVRPATTSGIVAPTTTTQTATPLTTAVPAVTATYREHLRPRTRRPLPTVGSYTYDQPITASKAFPFVTSSTLSNGDIGAYYMFTGNDPA